jgi:hemoglobin
MSEPTPAATSIYDTLGGEAGVRGLVDRFYDEMARNPAVQPLRAMHPPELGESRDKLFWFLSGWLGGPPLYVEKKGHPRLRARHMPFAVDSSARDQWMSCMRVALSTASLPRDIHEKLDTALFQLADHMINRQ